MKSVFARVFLFFCTFFLLPKESNRENLTRLQAEVDGHCGMQTLSCSLKWICRQPKIHTSVCLAVDSSRDVHAPTSTPYQLLNQHHLPKLSCALIQSDRNGGSYRYCLWLHAIVSHMHLLSAVDLHEQNAHEFFLGFVGKIDSHTSTIAKKTS